MPDIPGDVADPGDEGVNLATATDAGDISLIAIEEEMKRSYLDYAMSVIVARALPDVRDGLKPVHRRILFSMAENNYAWNRPYRKSARIVGDVIGKYHPHGDQSIYDALVRMAQPFSLRVPLVDGQGNFGSVDGDPPAAMRYTESRLSKAAHALLEDLGKNTVDFRPNYDESEREPAVLPARFPNLLVNGAGGIAVGMATNMAPHNTGEVIAACIAYLDDPDIAIETLMDILPGPDFPTGGLIIGRAGIAGAYHKGRGTLTVRGRTIIEPLSRDREAIIVTELPYQVNKAAMIERIAELVREKKIEGLSDIRDESDRQGMRVVIELKRDAVAGVVLNQLYRFTTLQSSFGVNAVALCNGRPELLNLKDLLRAFVEFRQEVVTRRVKYLLHKARERAHLLIGLAIAVANIDAFVALIRASRDAGHALASLMGRTWPARDMNAAIRLIDDPRQTLVEDGDYRLSRDQARAILDLRLQRLTALGREEITGELRKLGEDIADYLDILASPARVRDIIRTELREFGEEFSNPRRTEIVEVEADIEDEDLIARQEMVVTVSHAGYIKRVPLSSYRAQRRGGKGRAGMGTREEDFVTRLFVASTHAPVLIFTSHGMAYQFKVWRLPLAAPHAKGRPLINLAPLAADERMTAIMPLPEDEEEWGRLDIMFATRSGRVRRNRLSDFAGMRAGGKIAMKLDEGDSIIGVEICRRDAPQDVLLTTAHGRCIRFSVTDVRLFKGRDSTGVRGIALGRNDRAVSLALLDGADASAAERAVFLKRSRAGQDDQDLPGDDDASTGSEDAGILPQDRYEALQRQEQLILTICENGYGKRSSSHAYRVSGRGGKGIAAIAVSERNGAVVASFPVSDTDQIMLVTSGGKLIRCPVADIRIAGRATQGVTVFKTPEDERVVAVERVSESDQDEAPQMQEDEA